jgi:hypothetical protein
MENFDPITAFIDPSLETFGQYLLMVVVLGVLSTISWRLVMKGAYAETLHPKVAANLGYLAAIISLLFIISVIVAVRLYLKMDTINEPLLVFLTPFICLLVLTVAFFVQYWRVITHTVSRNT